MKNVERHCEDFVKSRFWKKILHLYDDILKPSSNAGNTNCSVSWIQGVCLVVLSLIRHDWHMSVPAVGSFAVTADRIQVWRQDRLHLKLTCAQESLSPRAWHESELCKINAFEIQQARHPRKTSHPLCIHYYHCQSRITTILLVQMTGKIKWKIKK